MGGADLKVYKSDLPKFEVANSLSRLQIGVASVAGNFATGSIAGDVVFRNIGQSHNLIFNIPDNNNDGNNYIGIGDEANGLWFKVFNNKIVRMDGKLIATEVQVRTNVWSDNVFTQDYRLRSLNELESFINANGHLPEVPSEQEVKENGGINVGEMNVILLKKVEELSLYVIELEKQVQELKKEVSDSAK
jgi:hypothetical protein